MATAADAELILKLYDLRREARLREARRFVIAEFKPATFADVEKLLSSQGDENAYWRQVLSYWEMAASLVLRGALDADLYLDSNGEGLFVYAKFSAFHADIQRSMGVPFMRNTAALVEKFPVAKERYERMVAMWAAMAAKGK